MARTLFDSRVHYGGWPSDGPYYAYVLSAGPEFAIINAPVIPKGAIRLGPISIQDSRRSGRYFDLVARLSFTVPDLPSGRYAIGICNDPCRDSGVDDLNGGSILIVHTQLEGRLFGTVGRLQGDLRSAKYQLRKSDKVANKLRADVTDERNAGRALQDQTAALQARLRAVSRRREPRPLIEGWVAIALTALVLVAVAAVIVGRRRFRDTAIERPAAADDRSKPAATAEEPVGKELVGQTSLRDP